MKDKITVEFLESFGSVNEAIQMAQSEYMPLPHRLNKPYLSDKNSIVAAKEYVKALEDYEINNPKYLAAVDAVKEFNNKINEVIIEYIKKESGLMDIPIQYHEKIFAKAYSDGHSSGYHAVYLELLDLVDIFQ